MAQNWLQAIKREWDHVFEEEIIGDELLEDDLLIRHDGSIAAGFYITLPEKYLLEESQIIAFQASMEGVLSQLPPGTTWHFQSLFYEKEFDISKIEINDYVTERLVLHQSQPDKKLLENKINFYLSFVFPKARKKDPLSTLLAAFRGKAEHPISNILQNKIYVKSIVQSFLLNTRGISRIGVRQMNEEEFHAERLKYRNLRFNKTPVGFTTDIENLGHTTKVGEMHFKVVYLRKHGNFLYNSVPNDHGIESYMAWPLSHYLHFPHIVNLGFMNYDNEEQLKFLDGKRKIRNSIKKIQNQDDALIAAEIEAFTQRARSEGKRLGYVTHNVMVWDADPQQLSIKIDLIKSAFLKMNGSIGNTDAYNTGSYFFAMSPGHADEMFNTNVASIDEALCLFDFSTSNPGDGEGIIMNNSDGEPVLIDLWTKRLNARNRVVIAPTGAGKSFTMNFIMSQEIEQGVQFVVIDVGGSYDTICELYKHKGAKYFEYTEKSPFSFNPFLLAKNKFGEYALTDEKIMFLLTLITCIWKKTADGESMTNEEESVVTNLLGKYYQSVNVFNRGASNTEKRTPILEGFVNFVIQYRIENKGKEEFEAHAQFFSYDSFTLCFREFTEGSYRRLLNNETNEDLTSFKQVFFDLKGIKDNKKLFPIVAMLLIELILDKIRQNPTIKKEIVIDEAWSMLTGNLANFIEYLYRTIRKSQGAVTAISQDVIPIENSPIGNAIKGNSSVVILLDHSEARQMIDGVQRFFDMTPHQINLVRKIRNEPYRRQIVLGRGGIYQIYFIDVGPHLGVAFSSWSGDKAVLADFNKEFGIRYAINRYVEEQSIAI